MAMVRVIGKDRLDALDQADDITFLQQLHPRVQALRVREIGLQPVGLAQEPRQDEGEGRHDHQGHDQDEDPRQKQLAALGKGPALAGGPDLGRGIEAVQAPGGGGDGVVVAHRIGLSVITAGMARFVA